MARLFDSTSDRISFGTDPLPLIGSLSLWAYPNWAQADGAVHMYFSAMAAATQVFQLLKFSNNSLYAGWYNTSEYRVIVASASYTQTQSAWNHFVLTWDDTANVSKLYLNGAQIGSSTSTLVAFTTTHSRTIGNEASEGVGDYSFDGRIAEVALYTAVLEASEVAALSKGFSPLLIRPTSLQHYLPLVREAQDRKGATVTEANTVVIEHPRTFYPSSGKVSAAAAAPPPVSIYPSFLKTQQRPYRNVRRVA